MTIKYEWRIDKIVTKKDSEEVAQVYWSKKGVDEEGNEGVFEGLINAEQIVIKEEGKYIPLNRLKEKDVIDWVQSSVTYEDHVNKMIDIQIEEKKNSSNVTTLPWEKASKKSK